GQGLKIPENGPYWEYPNEWENFNRLSNSKAGFTDSLYSYLKGSSFYKISDINENDLVKLVTDKTQEMRVNGYNREFCSAFSGGYVLKIDDNDKIFPQCCSDLGCIDNWVNLAAKQKDTYYQGHLAPIISFEDGFIVFDLTRSSTDYENFVPTPIETVIKVDRKLLSNAVIEVQKELELFSIILNKINSNNNLNISNIEKLLIYGHYD
ncbi:MAG: hypothetical protein ACRC3B_19085, partial [Bacteroidia bacterium]